MGRGSLTDGVLLSVASSKGKMSLSFLWLSLGVVQDLGRMLYFATSLGVSLAFEELFGPAKSIYHLSQLNLTRDLNGFFLK